MASNPISPGKRRKDSLNQLRRDRPLFANRQPKGLQQQSEFFTESLNTSFIPSPSPKRSPMRAETRPQPRRDRGSGRSLTAAFRAIIPENHEDKSSSSSFLAKQYLEDVVKPMPDHSQSRSLSTLDTPDAPSTPSPPRGRQGFIGSPASSASASSPPRGLAEAYQRIVDEENLAQDDTEAFDYTEDFLHHPNEVHERVMQRKRSSESPTSLRTLRKSVSREPQATNGSIDDEATQHSSPRSSLDDATQSSVGSGLSRHAKDAQRIAGAINSDIKVFSKAKTGPRHSLSARMLDRQNGSAESLHSSVSGSVDSRLSDPARNVPRAWGRKSKPTKKWLDRIKSPSGRLTGDTSNDQKNKSPIITESESRIWDEPIDKWIQAAATTPLPVGQDSSQAPSSSQDVLQITNGIDANSDDMTRGWDNDDFTARSLQASQSPPLKNLAPALGRMRSQELDSLEKRAVTTSRLVALKDRESRENLRRPLKEKEPEPQGPEQSQHFENNRDENEVTEQKHKANIGGRVPGTPVVVLSNANGEDSQRPQDPEQDSHDLLRRLARSASNSPHPIQNNHQETPMPKGSLDDSALPDRTQQANNTRQQLTHRPGKAPEVIGGWVDTILEDTPKVSVPDVNNNRYLKTPLVTGAWVGTPLPVGGRGPPMPTPEMDEDSTLQLGDGKRKVAASELIRKLSPHTTRPSLKSTAPTLPRSALESIITAARADAKAGGDMESDEDASLHLGDSTIASLEGILTNEDKAHPPTPPSSTEDTSEVIATPYTRQLKRLQSLVPSLRSTRKNISSLERAVSRSNERKAEESEECHEGGEVHDFILPCSKCSGAGGNHGLSLVSFNVHDRFTTVEVPLPTLWTWPEGVRPRLTWVGVITLLVWAWWIAETVACSMYCHHPVSAGHFGFGFDYDAPEPPFVLEKVIYRSLSVGTVMHSLYLLLRFSIRNMASVVGYLAGLGSRGDTGDPTAGHHTSPSWGPDSSMMNDEYL